MNISMYLYPLYIAAVVFVLIYLIYRFVIKDYMSYPKELTFDDSLAIINTIINLELDIYENDVFDKQDTLSNAQYENFLQDIITRIDNALSPVLVASITRYMSEGELYTWIIRLVRRYFDKKAIVDDYDVDEDESE